MVIYTDGSFSMDLLSSKAEEHYITTVACTKVLANLRKQWCAKVFVVYCDVTGHLGQDQKESVECVRF